MFFDPQPTPADAEAAEEAPGRSHEERRVLSWRFRQIRSLGFSHVDARMLAETGADLGLIRRLVGEGCPTPLALKIAL